MRGQADDDKRPHKVVCRADEIHDRREYHADDEPNDARKNRRNIEKPRTLLPPHDRPRGAAQDCLT
jgi:hypothetical protein